MSLITASISNYCRPSDIKGTTLITFGKLIYGTYDISSEDLRLVAVG